MVPGSSRETAARLLLDRLRLRTTLNECVGIMQVWHLCERQQARDRLLADHGRGGQNAEARRVVAIIDATADGSADPDARWD